LGSAAPGDKPDRDHRATPIGARRRQTAQVGSTRGSTSPRCNLRRRWRRVSVS